MSGALVAGVDRTPSLGSSNVVGILATHVANRLVVADGEVRRRTSQGSVSSKTARAVLSEAANVGGRLPDDLGEVTPDLEVGRVLNTVVRLVGIDLAVVELVGDDLSDIPGRGSSRDVLAVATTIDISVVSIVAGAGDLLSSARKTVIPGDSWSRVVEAMDVMMEDDLGSVRIQSRGRRRWWGSLRRSRSRLRSGVRLRRVDRSVHARRRMSSSVMLMLATMMGMAMDADRLGDNDDAVLRLGLGLLRHVGSGDDGLSDDIHLGHDRALLHGDGHRANGGEGHKKVVGMHDGEILEAVDASREADRRPLVLLRLERLMQGASLRMEGLIEGWYDWSVQELVWSDKGVDCG